MNDLKGMDTETVRGVCRVLAIEGAGVWRIPGRTSLLTLLRTLPLPRDLVAWNLDYDAHALLRVLFDPDTIYRVYRGVEVRDRDITVLYLRPKRFVLTVGGRRYRIYDAAQFFGMGLNAAARKFLGEGKLGINASKITHRNIWSKRVLDYCLRDAELAGRLYRMFRASLKNYVPDDREPLSSAYLSVSAFRDGLEKGKTWGIFRPSYYGGRFEVFERGHFKGVWYADINSAYPYATSSLLGVRDAVLREGSVYSAYADYGVYDVTVNVPTNWKASPVPYRLREGLLIFPCGEFRATVGRTELSILRRLRCVRQIHHSYELFCESSRRVFSHRVYELYRLRKREGFFGLKIVLNGLYGKLAQMIERTIPDDRMRDGAPVSSVSRDGYVTMPTVGYTTCWPWASEITARTRAMLWHVLEGDPYGMLAVATDSILCRRRPKVPEGNRIGQWKVERWRDAWIFLSGVYFFRRESGEIEGRVRGFRCVGRTAEDILDHILSAKRRVISLPVTARVGAHEAYTLDVAAGNVLYSALRRLDLGSDRKRIWPTPRPGRWYRTGRERSAARFFYRGRLVG